MTTMTDKLSLAHTSRWFLTTEIIYLLSPGPTHSVEVVTELKSFISLILSIFLISGRGGINYGTLWLTRLLSTPGCTRGCLLIEIIYKESDEVERYTTFYQIEKWPYISVIDPRYRARLLYLREVRFCTYYVLEIKGPARTCWPGTDQHPCIPPPRSLPLYKVIVARLHK